MTRREIERKFDEIVAFAEVEKFLDTPVKRYSSGMYVRLAFAVAAHLEPEILIVDEVLSVGDAAFQRRCIAKMGEFSRNGGTALVVSHNLGVIQSLCPTAVQLERGSIVGDGSATAQVTDYLARQASNSTISIAKRADREGNGAIRVSDFRFTDDGGNNLTEVVCGSSLVVRLDFARQQIDLMLEQVALSCWSIEGVKLFHIDTTQSLAHNDLMAGQNTLLCRIPRIPLSPGVYHWNVLLRAASCIQDHVYNAAVLEVLPGDFFGTGRTPLATNGMLLIDHSWIGLAHQTKRVPLGAC
jgi:lipopolysaccharide transport system ATP-binding protein